MLKEIKRVIVRLFRNWRARRDLTEAVKFRKRNGISLP
jgi:hypothetical protein